MDAYAIVEGSGRQFLMQEGRFYDLHRINGDIGKDCLFNNIILVNKDDQIDVGKPSLSSTHKVKIKLLRHLAGKKIRVYKMRPKKKTRKTFGFRPKLTRILVDSIIEKSSGTSSCTFS